MNSLILPKLSEIEDVNHFLANALSVNQCNDNVEPIWEGSAVIFNAGANEYVDSEYKNSAWYSSFVRAQKYGGLDNRIGIVTQYEDSEKVAGMNALYGKPLKPWVRVCSFIERGCPLDTYLEKSLQMPLDTYKYSITDSISIEARFFSTVPINLLHQAVSHVARKDRDFQRQFDEFMA